MRFLSHAEHDHVVIVLMGRLVLDSPSNIRVYSAHKRGREKERLSFEWKPGTYCK
jgi:hypothetical protein